MRSSLRALAHTLILAVAVAAPSVQADVPPPDTEECRGKQAGDACGAGKCVEDKCSRLDYASWDRDASAGPPAREYDCLRCSAEARPAPPVADAQAATSDAGERDEKDKSSGCSAGGQAAAQGFAWLSGVLAAWVAWRRRQLAC